MHKEVQEFILLVVLIIGAFVIGYLCGYQDAGGIL